MKVFKLFYGFLICALASGCTKVVNINLNKAAPQIIIEANLSDQPSSCLVKLSKTVNFDESNVFPAVSGASVSISDNLGNTSAMVESSIGIYTCPALQAVPGRKYTLNVNSEGKTYSASSTVFAPVSIDSLIEATYAEGGISGSQLSKLVQVRYRDPAGVDNYYRIIETTNHVVSDAIFIAQDRLRDGSVITTQLLAKGNALHTGDSVIVRLQTIDKPVFDYLTQLNQLITGGNGILSTSPANPLSNFNNGALGYFSAHAETTKSIKIQ
jgi:hypothetical protein